MLPGDKKVPSLNGEDNENCEYLGVLLADNNNYSEMKERIQKKCFRKVKTKLKSKLNDGNTIKAINSRAVSSVRYGAGIVDWTKEEQKVMDRKTRKLMHK